MMKLTFHPTMKWFDNDFNILHHGDALEAILKSAVFVLVSRYHVDLLPQSKIEKKQGD